MSEDRLIPTSEMPSFWQSTAVQLLHKPSSVPARDQGRLETMSTERRGCNNRTWITPKPAPDANATFSTDTAKATPCYAMFDDVKPTLLLL